MTSLTRNAYAKINLTLDVGQCRPDGYHEIASIMQTVGLHDTVIVTRSPDVPGVRLEVVGDESSGVPSDETNLVHRAAVRLQQEAASRNGLSGLQITLHKRIPSQAGLGGGSSDAAATLQAVNELLGLSLSHERLTGIGTSLGADIPFFLSGGTALVKGLGERVTSLGPLFPMWHLIIVKPPIDVSTGGAYAALDAMRDRRPGTDTEAMLNGARHLGNDFEKVILPTYEEIAAAHAALHWTEETDESFRPLLCGSGSAVFRRVSSRKAGRLLAARIEGAGLGKTWVTTTQGECEWR